jgi:hypothetical protein
MVFRRRARAALVPAIAGCLSLVLSGCTIEDLAEHTARVSGHSSGAGETPSGYSAKATRFSFSYSATEAFVGKKVSEANGDGTGQFGALTTKGPFKAKLPPAARRLAGGAHAAKGTFIATYDGTWDRNTSSGTTSGTVLLKFSNARLGELCFVADGKYTYTESPAGVITMDGTGTFKSSGGTHRSAAQKTTGTWTQTVISYPENRPDDVHGTFAGAYRKASKQPLPAACQELAKSL